MTQSVPIRAPDSRTAKLIRRFMRNRGGASAVEFAIVAMPFFLLLMGIVQVGIFYMAQSALDAGVIRSAESLRNSFNTATTTPVMPDAATLKSNVSTLGGGMIANNGSLSVELRQATTLTSGAIAITDGTVDYGTTSSTLVLRAQATVVTLAPGLGSMNIIRSSAMVRRQGT